MLYKALASWMLHGVACGDVGVAVAGDVGVAVAGEVAVAVAGEVAVAVAGEVAVAVAGEVAVGMRVLVMEKNSRALRGPTVPLTRSYPSLQRRVPLVTSGANHTSRCAPRAASISISDCSLRIVGRRHVRRPRAGALSRTQEESPCVPGTTWDH